MVCLEKNLDLLVIPKTKQFVIDYEDTKYGVIAEECLSFEGNPTIQEELHLQNSSKLKETIRQLAEFIAATGFFDVDFRNIPIYKSLENYFIALIDLEALHDPKTGFLGKHSRNIRGLISCVSEDLIYTVTAVAIRHGIITRKEAEEAKQKRLEELDLNEEFKTFYTNKSIKTGKEPIDVDIKTLGFDLSIKSTYNCKIDEKWTTKEVTLGEFTEELVKEINAQIKESSEKNSIKWKRKGKISKCNGLFFDYRLLGLDKTCKFKEEDRPKSWFAIVFQALVKKGHLFSFRQDQVFSSYMGYQA